MANILYRGAAAPTATNTAGNNNAPLTNDQIDKNFYALDSAKFEKSGGTITGDTTFNTNVTVSGNLTVSGTTTTINTTNLQVSDANIELGKVATPSDTTANGGGITLKGGTDKTISWDSANSNWTSSEHWNLASGKTFKVNNTEVLSATTVQQLPYKSFLPNSFAISAYDRTSNVVTITTTSAHGFAVNDVVTVIPENTASTFWGAVGVTITAIPTSTSFKYAQTGANEVAGAGGYALKSNADQSSFILRTTGGDTRLGNTAYANYFVGQWNGVSIPTAKIADGAITTAKITDANVTSAKLENSGVTAGTYNNVTVSAKGLVTGGSNVGYLTGVVTANITDLNVTTAKIADAAITSAKLASDSVTTIKILDANVTTAKIADLGVTAAKLAADAVTTIKILDANVTGAKLENSGVTAGTYSSVTVDAKGRVTAGSNPGYLTSYTESDTLTSVTGRGASTANVITLTGGDGSNSSLKLSGANGRGGAEYHGFLEATNTKVGTTNPNKFFRLNGVGGLEIVNSAYNAVIYTLTDGGALTVSGNINASNFSGSHSGTSSGTNTGDISLSAGTNVTISQSGSTYTINSSYTDTITRIRTGGNTFASGDFTFSASGASSISQTGGSINISSTDTNTWDANALNVAGYVAAPSGTTANKVWKTDGSGNPAWRDDADTVYSLPLAANGTRGGVQIGYTETGKNYAVQLSGEKMYVNVPWTDTTYTAGTGLTLTTGTFSVNASQTGITSVGTLTGLNVSGAIVATGDVTAFGTISDRTLKENIVPFTGALDKVNSINSYYFNYKNDPRRLIGVIAQELEPHLPELVYEFTPVGTEETKKAVKYELLTAVLLEAIKELNAKVEDLQNQLANK
jgi:hypothetical protein